MKEPFCERVQTAVGSGRWFPADRLKLERMVTGFIENAESSTTGRVVAALAPHAGYVYSGPVSGYTFRAIRDGATGDQRPDTVVVLGFCHGPSFRGVALMDADTIETPLGACKLDTGAATNLVGSSPRIRFDNRPHQGEHSAENQIPFLQVALPGTPLVVALIGDHDSQTMDELTRALVALSKEKHLLVIASTDMLHDPDYDKVTRTDRTTLRQLERMDIGGLTGAWSYEHQVLCGIAPVLTVLKYARAMGCSEGAVLKYGNSGDDHPDSRGSWVVGYGAVIYR